MNKNKQILKAETSKNDDKEIKLNNEEKKYRDYISYTWKSETKAKNGVGKTKERQKKSLFDALKINNENAPVARLRNKKRRFQKLSV